jgi:hypothetical protein
MTIETMKQAREALALLDYLWYQSANMNPQVVERKMYAAISTLCTAIEQAKQQEPVAWRVRLKGNRHWGIWDRNPFDVLMPDQYDIEPLYAEPFSSQNKGEQK